MTIGNETVSKQQFGMTTHRKQFELTFTGNPLLRSQVQVVDYGTHVYSYDDSIETDWDGAHIMDGVVVWKKSGNIPFADMLLDFVQLGVIDWEIAERSVVQKNEEQSESLKHLDVNDLGQVVMKQEGFDVREARVERMREEGIA